MLILHLKFQAETPTGMFKATVIMKKELDHYLIQTIAGSRLTSKLERTYPLAMGRVRTILIGFENMEVI